MLFGFFASALVEKQKTSSLQSQHTPKAFVDGRLWLSLASMSRNYGAFSSSGNLARIHLLFDITLLR
jgi:hypothetical protein